MLTAKQARQIVDTPKPIADLEHILKCIESSAKEGRTNFWSTRNSFTDEQLQQLKELGYEVTIDNEKDYKISW